MYNIITQNEEYQLKAKIIVTDTAMRPNSKFSQLEIPNSKFPIRNFPNSKFPIRNFPNSKFPIRNFPNS